MATQSKQITLSNILDEVVALRKEVQELKSTAKTSKGSGASKAPRKPKDPNAPPKPPNAWIVFTGVVRDALTSAGLPAGKQAQQYASHLKDKFPTAYEMSSEAILAEHASWTPPAAKPKAKDDKEKPVESSEPKAKPARKPLSEEHKAAMAAGRKAAAERKKLEAAAKATEAVPEAKAEMPMPKAVDPPAAPSSELKNWPFKGKRCLLDPETNGLWLRNADGTKGTWQGVLSENKKDIDTSIPNPDED